MIHPVSSVKNASFDPDSVTPCNTGTRESHHRPVHRHLTFSSSEEEDDDTPADEIPSLTVYHQCRPPRCLSATIFHIHFECIHYPRRGRRRR